MRDLVEVEVVGDDLRVDILRQFDQFEIDFADLRIIILDDLNGEQGITLHTLEDVESAAPSLTFGAVLGIGHHLQLAKYELRDNERAFEEACLSHIGNAAVNDSAGIQHLQIAFTRAALGVKKVAECPEIEQISLACPD